jgi:RNA-directed DNA polymerase
MSRLKLKIKDHVKIGRTADQIIMKLNPILRGWANYYACTAAKRIFTSMDHY